MAMATDPSKVIANATNSPGRLTRRLEGFGTTIFSEMTRLAIEHEAINLAQGFPDFDGPEFVKEAAIAAIRAGHGQYAPMAGLPALRQALAAKAERFHGLRYDPESEVTVTCGATEAVFSTLAAVCDTGDEVVLFEPFYDSYRASVCMAGAIPRVVTLYLPDWRFDPAELAAAFTPRTRAIVLNSPHNPTGKVFSRDELALIADLAQKHDCIVISDEVYEHLVYEGKHLPIATLPGMRDRTVTISSLGKSYSLTGWKIGWALAPKALTTALRTAHQFVTFAIALPLQHGAVAAINAPESYDAQTLAEYRSRRTLLADGLTAAGFKVLLPQGSYFICAELAAGRSDVEFCRALPEKIGVAAIPPSAFYARSTEGSRYVRFAFCKQEATLRQAVERLATLSW
jgi:N-succinyldiaminopimelate aminotransferase